MDCKMDLRELIASRITQLNIQPCVENQLFPGRSTELRAPAEALTHVPLIEAPVGDGVE